MCSLFVQECLFRWCHLRIAIIVQSLETLKVYKASTFFGTGMLGGELHLSKWVG